MGLAPRHRNRGHRRHHQGTHWPTLYSFLKLTEFLCVCVCVCVVVFVFVYVCLCVCVCMFLPCLTGLRLLISHTRLSYRVRYPQQTSADVCVCVLHTGYMEIY